MMHNEFSEYNVTTLERGMMIIELLAQHPEGLGISDIALILDFPKSFIFRATGALHFRGYLTRDEKSKKFLLSSKLLSLGYNVLQQSGLLETAMPLMRKLCDDVGETIVLCAIEGSQGIALDSVPGTHPFRFVVETGMHFPLHTSAPGKALLAFMDGQAAKKIINRLSFERFTENTITDGKLFLDELKTVRSCGYGTDRGEEYDGVACVSAPVFDKSGKAIAAVTVTGPTSRLTYESLEDVGRKTVSTAMAISVEMGYNSLGKINGIENTELFPVNS